MTPRELWQALGGAGEPHSTLGSCHGPLLVLGGARCVWEDFEKVRPWGGEIMAVNDIGAILHCEVRHWATLHPEYFPGWRFYRERHAYPRNFTCHAPKVRDGVDVAWPIEQRGGSSGLFAAHVGLLLGYERIVLAGIPMDGGGHYFDPPWQDKSDFAKPDRTVWAEASRRFEGKVRSLSGRTRGWLGEPTKEWIGGN